MSSKAKPQSKSSGPPLIVSDRIQDAFLLNILPTESRLYVWPFLIAYLVWLLFVASYIVSNGAFNELLLIPLALVGLGQFLTFMSIFWNVQADAFLGCRRVPSASIADAEFICVIPKEHNGKSAIVPLTRHEGTEAKLSFTFHQEIFYYDANKKIFAQPIYPDQLLFSHYRNSRGLETAKEVHQATELFGKNRFEIASPSFMELFREHAVAPFFVFQVFCVGLWCLDEYWYYSVFTLFMLVVFESTVVAQRLKSLTEFRSMSLTAQDILVRRESKWQTIKSDDLLPGDFCYLKMDSEELTVPCDLLLIAGSCIVNEAMISGESTPLLKESVLEHRPKDEVELSLDIAAADKSHVLFGGTRVLQLTPPQSDLVDSLPSSPNSEKDGVFAYVLRTGFGTMQGELVRTMMYSSERMSANNLESFVFIGFLLIFAVAAATYVLLHGLDDPERNRYKLLLECALIVTAVVPPELPMELSLAVNNSLLALGKFAIFCMEPFRIPFAGKVDICCFDKTGTLTGENLVVEGVIAPNKGKDELLKDPSMIPADTILAIATCHSLFSVNDAVAGDPMEKAGLDFAKWTLPKNDLVVGPKKAVEILNRFPFSSALKRMSCLIRTGDQQVSVVAKGAPETMQQFFSSVPSWYEACFQQLALSGARVIALGKKDIAGKLSVSDARSMKREAAESGLTFAGFLVFRCPLKPDSKAAIRALKKSSHRVCMITGDNALTAISTAKDLDMTYNKDIVLLEWEQGLKASLVGDTKIEEYKLNHTDKEIAKKVSLCLAGAAVEELDRTEPDLLRRILPWVCVFARTSPSQKEFILTTLKQLGYITLMCGDGTNDVGALKQAHIGVALLDGKPEDLKEILNQSARIQMKKRRAEVEQSRVKWQAKMEEARRAAETGQSTPSEVLSASLQEKLDAIAAQADDETPMVKLGDASVAAPFTSKISTIEAVCSIIRQGRCTLVTTIQMYKILALNSLISAYGLSVLHLAGIRYGDFQVTITGVLLSACFLFLTRSEPIKKLSSKRPQPNILNAYLLLSVLLQFAIHVGTLIVVMSDAGRFSFPHKISHKAEFAPSLVNTAVYLLSLVMQLSTFVVNYQGRPFRESLFENKNLRNSLLAVSGVAIVAATEMIPEFNEWLQLVPMPPTFRRKLLSILFLDFFGCWAVEAIAHRLLFTDKPKY